MDYKSNKIEGQTRGKALISISLRGSLCYVLSTCKHENTYTQKNDTLGYALIVVQILLIAL